MLSLFQSLSTKQFSHGAFFLPLSLSLSLSLSAPNEVQEPKFVMWLFHRLCAKDIPTLYLVMVTIGGAISPKSARGACLPPKLACLFVLAQFALSCTRLVVALDGGRKPTWLRCDWRALPPECKAGLHTRSFRWFASILPWLKGSDDSSAVYLTFSNSGLYIGKANALRAQGSKPGIPERFVEHVVGLCFVNSRDGSLPRYRILRQTMGALGMLPLAHCP